MNRITFFSHFSILDVVYSLIELSRFYTPSFKVTSEIPMGAGLGSSAAFSVALAAALFHLQNSIKDKSSDEEADKEIICNWAFKSEKIIHGNPSGKEGMAHYSWPLEGILNFGTRFQMQQKKICRWNKNYSKK